MSIAITATSVEVLGKTYQIKCPENEVIALQKAAQYLEEQMSEIRSHTQILSIDRIAIIAALNVTHKLLTLEHQILVDTQKTQAHLEALNKKLDAHLTPTAQLELSTGN